LFYKILSIFKFYQSKRVVFALLIVLLCLLFSGLSINWQLKQSLAIDDTSLVINRGQSLRSIIQTIYPDASLLSNRLREIIASKILAIEPKFGQYDLTQYRNFKQFLTAIHNGKIQYYNLTLVEGWTMQQAVAYLRQLPHLKSSDTQWQIPQSSIFAEVESTEGMIAADTYYYSQSDSVNSILDVAHQKLQTIAQQQWQQSNITQLPYSSIYDALIMASIIEKETGVAYERPLIAGVFVSRLQLGMRLETDPTIIYGLGDAYQGDIKRRHLKQFTPYNTYIIKGLPPTPIAIVGEDAMIAALNPMIDGSLFFVAKGDGSHYFSQTYEEHRQAVQKYQIDKRRTDYRSSPKKP